MRALYSRRVRCSARSSDCSTRVSRSLNENGLGRKSASSLCSDRTRVARSDAPDRNRMGTEAVRRSRHSSRATLKPSVSGSFTSRMIRSGVNRRAATRPSSPRPVVTASKPSASSASCTPAAMSASSSITSTRRTRARSTAINPHSGVGRLFRLSAPRGAVARASPVRARGLCAVSTTAPIWPIASAVFCLISSSSGARLVRISSTPKGAPATATGTTVSQPDPDRAMQLPPAGASSASNGRPACAPSARVASRPPTSSSTRAPTSAGSLLARTRPPLSSSVAVPGRGAYSATISSSTMAAGSPSVRP